jgi:hypothetical protein
MKRQTLDIGRRLRILLCAAMLTTLFVLPAGYAFARGGHGGGGHGGSHASAAHASVAHGGFGPGSIHSSGMNHGRFAAGHSVQSSRIISGRSSFRASQRSGNFNHHFVAGHHYHNHIFFGFGYPYRYGYYPYSGDVCNPYSPYYDPYYCQQLYYRGY